MASFTQAPIYIYSSAYHEGERYTAHPIGVEENEKRLREFSVDPKRISKVSDPSSLKRLLETQEKSILILGGGYAPFLTKELEELHATIHAAIKGGTLRVWGQCAGAMAVCQQLSVPSRNPAKFRPLKQLNLLPLVADADVYPIEKDELANRKIVSLLSVDNKLFKSYWYRGAHFKALPEASQTGVTLVPLTCYEGALTRSNVVKKPVETICGVHPSGAVVIASGAHSEIADVDMNPEQMVACQKLRFDANRVKHLKSVYEILGVIPKTFEAKRPLIRVESGKVTPPVQKKVVSIALRNFTLPERQMTGVHLSVREKPLFSSSVMFEARKIVRF